MHSEIKEIADRSYINPGTFPCTQTIPYEYSTMPGKRMLLPAIPGTQPVNTVSRSQQVTEDTKKRRKRGRIPVDKSGFCCMNCGTKETPEWRRGPAGRNTYCNACGMRYSKQNKKKKGSGEQEASPLDLSFSPTSQFEKKLTSASKTRKIMKYKHKLDNPITRSKEIQDCKRIVLQFLKEKRSNNEAHNLSYRKNSLKWQKERIFQIYFIGANKLKLISIGFKKLN